MSVDVSSFVLDCAFSSVLKYSLQLPVRNSYTYRSISALKVSGVQPATALIRTSTASQFSGLLQHIAERNTHI